jgi:hypothetical protein
VFLPGGQPYATPLHQFRSEHSSGYRVGTSRRASGSAIGAASVAIAEPPEINCTQFNEDRRCYYPNCSYAKANDECNISEGSPHYCPKQDRDGDGVACEC